MKEKIFKKLAALSLRLDNWLYKLTSFFSIKAEGGIHPKHRLIGYHNFFLRNISPSQSVLDVGCGNGALARDLAAKAGRVLGIDKEEKKIEEARKNFRRPNLEYAVGDATSFSFEKNFDVVVLSNVLEHIEDRVDFLKKIKKISPKILIRVPMFDRDWRTAYKKELGVSWKSDRTHFTEYTEESFRKELEEAGLEIISLSVRWGEIWAVAGVK